MEEVDWNDAMWDLHLANMDTEVQSELTQRAIDEASG